MDLILNDGTLATNGTIFEYEQLKAKGYVGHDTTVTTNHIDKIITYTSKYGTVPDVDKGYT